MLGSVQFKSPITDLKVDNGFSMPRIVRPYHSGEYVSLRMVTGETEKTYLGLMLGDMNIGFGIRHQEGDTTAEIVGLMGNPAIFVPELSQLVYGAECWWKLIARPADMKDISNAEIKRWGDFLKAQIEKYEPIIAKYEREDAERRKAKESAAADDDQMPPGDQV